MKFNSNYILREIAGESLLVRQGRDGIDMTRVVALNPSGAFLYGKFKENDFNEEDLAHALAEEFAIDISIARNDACNWLNTLRQYDAITD